MIQTFSLSPYIGAIGGLLGHFLILLYSIWFKEVKEPSKPLLMVAFRTLKGIFYIFFCFLGILMVDLALFWLFGQWTYADWRYQLPSVLISLIFGIQYLWGTLFRRAKWDSLLLGIYILVSTLIVLHWHIPNNLPIKGSFETVFIPFISAIVIFLIYGLFSLKMEKGKENTIIFDASKIYDVIFRPIVNWVFFFIALAEVSLKFLGTSIFAW